jgi:hypothetical protein
VVKNFSARSIAVGGAGSIGFGLAFVFPVGALIVTSLGLVMGIWGVYSRKRGAAILGLLICCVAFATAGFNGAVELYTYAHGVSPFETYVPVTVEEWARRFRTAGLRPLEADEGVV